MGKKTPQEFQDFILKWRKGIQSHTDLIKDAFDLQEEIDEI